MYSINVEKERILQVFFSETYQRCFTERLLFWIENYIMILEGLNKNPAI